MLGANTTQHLNHSSYFQGWWRLHHFDVMLVIGKDLGVFRVKRSRIALSTSKILEENLVSNTLGDKFTFQQELLTKMTSNVPEWPSYSFDLNWLENQLQDLKMAVKQ
jgi:hypothetical protein